MPNTSVRTHVVIPSELVSEVDELVGKRRRSEFIVLALRERLVVLRRRKAALAVRGSVEDDESPGWDTPESTSEWVRNVRQESDRYGASSAN